MTNQPLLALTIGDAAGVGPEVAIKGILAEQRKGLARMLLVGDAEAVARTASTLSEEMPKIVSVTTPEDVPQSTADALYVLDAKNLRAADWQVGELSAVCGQAAVEDTETAVALALAGRVGAVVSGPINKQGMQLAGRRYPGQTEFIRDLTSAEQPLKILVGGNLRVAQLTSHMSLRDAIGQVTQDRITATAIRLAEALRTAWGIEAPRVCVSALNPHAGDNGLLGKEELEQINPGVQAARERGYDVVGAVPSDIAFLHGEEGRYDGVVSLFHDQGTLPLKRLKFASTPFGLPIIRTTPGHGTAYDIAGKGTADATAMRNAIDLATTLASQKAGTGVGSTGSN